MFKLDLVKAEEPKIKLPVFIGDHTKGKRIPGKKIYFIEYTKVLTVWIITNVGNS